MTASPPAPAVRRPLLLGLIGTGIQQSRTPAMHMREAAAQGIPCVYRVIGLTEFGLGVEALPELLVAAERMGFDGLNITHPCKQAVVPLLTALSAEAAALDAVNTVMLRGGRRIGHNTDCSGFAEGFRRQLPDVPLGRAVQLGAGGAGTAVAEAAMRLGVGRLTLFDMDRSRAEAVAAALCARHGEDRAVAGADLSAAMAESDGLIHATPTGMAAHPGLPLDPALLQPRHWVSEVVYVPMETELLRLARARGCRTAHGGGMAVFQAVHAFRHFSGVEPDAGRMLAHFAEMVGG
jgi:shikimate dehydrogenase